MKKTKVKNSKYKLESGFQVSVQVEILFRLQVKNSKMKLGITVSILVCWHQNLYLSGSYVLSKLKCTDLVVSLLGIFF